jgi:NADH:ubiquinone oxidoreductase subunit H
MASYTDNRFGDCDLLWPGVFHDRKIKTAVVIRLFTAEPATANQEHKMEWVIALIVVVIVPFGIVLWLIPHYDVIGVQKAKDRIARESTAAQR